MYTVEKDLKKSEKTKQMQQNSDFRHWQSIGAFFIVSILLGSIPPITKWTILYINPTAILAVRYIIALALFMPWIGKFILSLNSTQNPLAVGTIGSIDFSNISENEVGIRNIGLIKNSVLFRDGLILGILTFGIHLGLSIGVQTISANRTSFIFGLCAVFVSVLELIYRKRFIPRIFGAAILAFGGSSLMFWEQSYEPVIGSLWVLGAIVCEAIILFLLEDIAPRHDPVTLSILRLGTATTLAMFIAIPELPNQLAVIVANWIPLLYLGVVTAAITWLVIFALKSLPASEAALIQTSEPVFGTIISFLVLGESFGWRGLMGSGLILIGTTLAVLNSSNGLAEKNNLLPSMKEYNV
jgi:drug/metabolite transporter (DMT)-like permease